MLEKICNFIVDKRKWFMTVFVLLTIVFAVCIFFVNINYDMTDYLPKDSETFKAMDTMFDEFGEGAVASIMISDIPDASNNLLKVLDIREKVEKVKGVNHVLWIDTALKEIYPTVKDVTVHVPIFGDKTIGQLCKDENAFVKLALGNFSLLIKELDKYPDMKGQLDMMLGQFFKDDKVLLQVFFDENSYSKTTVHAIDDIKEIVTDSGYKVSLGGMAASAYAMETIMESELFKLIMIVAPTIIVLLFLATSSYFEPIVYLLIIGISVILNMGSNIMMNSVSYLTFSIAALIQMAVSMDYSIFIMHAYKDNRKNGMQPIEASKAALRKSLTSVSASSLTTIAGFIALVFMSYKIGTDIGLVLAKGILCSLLTAFLFMPGFVVLCDKPIMKGEHRTIFRWIKDTNLKRKAKKYGTTVEYLQAQPKKHPNASNNLLKLRFIVPILFVALLAPAYMAQNNNHFMYGELASSGGDGSTLMVDRAEIQETFGSQNQMVVLINKEYSYEEEKALADKLAKVENVGMVQSMAVIEGALPEGMQVPGFLKAQFIGKHDYRMIMLIIDNGEVGEEDPSAFKVVDDVKKIVSEELDGGYYVIGNSVVAEDLKVINQKDYTLSTGLALLFIFIILLFTFKGLILPLILALLIQGSIWYAMTIPAFSGMTIVFLGYLIVSCFQMGCTIDYGILFSNNYLNYRKDNDKLTACKLAFKNSIGAISLSAAILMTVGYVVGIAGSIPATSNIGLLLGIGATVSYIAMTYILPLFLVLFDKPIRLTTLKFKSKKEKEVVEEKQDN